MVKLNKISSHSFPLYHKSLTLYRKRSFVRRNILPGISGSFTGKELDPETGFYYYRARYLDPKTSRWISGDPAIEEYIPGAPVNDEVKKQNQNLPGQGGVFNLVNLHVYHYAGNNPVKYTDPDGRSGERQEDNSDKTKIARAINNIEKTKFAKTYDGKIIIGILRELNNNDKITIKDLDSGDSAQSKQDSNFEYSIEINSSVPEKALAGRLVHEGTHIKNMQAGMPKSLNDERMAFDNAYMVDKELKSPIQRNLSDTELEFLYSDLKWEENSR
jgi:hypothetical protein